jgi:hypothetical protein
MHKKRCEYFLGKIMVPRDRLPGDLDFSPRRDMAPDAFIMRDLPLDSGTVCTVSKACAIAAVEDLSFDVMV